MPPPVAGVPRRRARCPCPPGTWPFDEQRFARRPPAPARRSSARAGPVDRMISFARSTSVTPGSCTRIWSPFWPCCAMLGSVTPSSLTRRSIVCARLHDRLLAQLDLHVRLHRERVGAVGARARGRSSSRPRPPPGGTPRPAPAARLRPGTCVGSSVVMLVDRDAALSAAPRAAAPSPARSRAAAHRRSCTRSTSARRP